MDSPLRKFFASRVTFGDDHCIAYETVANKEITAGNTSDSELEAKTQQDMKSDRPSLGMLALGADGLALWRREEALTGNLK